MIYEKDLTIYFDATEKSRELNDYQRDNWSVLSLPDSSFIYIGLYKPFNALYVEMLEGNTETTGNMTISYSDGTDFTNTVPFPLDETLNFQRSGFLKWNKPSDWSKFNLNGDDLYWIQLKTDVTTTALDFRAINILFSNDNELRKELATIDKYLPPTEQSFASMHSTVRDDIVQSLRNRGKAKRSSSNTFENITKWDLLDIDEVWTASKYLALEKIFWQASDGVGDKWEERQRWASQEGNKAFDLMFLSIDTDDDGIKDQGESMKIQTVKVQRI